MLSVQRFRYAASRAVAGLGRFTSVLLVARLVVADAVDSPVDIAVDNPAIVGVQC